MGTRLALVGVVVAVVALLALDVRATYGARISVDEPQYLLSAISLSEDLDLNIADELAAERYRTFHEVRLLPQTIALDEAGTRISPHDPLLPALLAVPYALGGWVGARVAMAAMVGVCAALAVALAERRFDVSANTAALVVGGFFVSPPLVSYGNQIYPAMAAAIAVLVGVLVILGDPHRHRWIAVLAIVALPWLAVKYVPLAAVLAAGLLWRLRSHRSTWPSTLGALAVSALGYLVAHRVLYGGWTVYATGDHFVDGEWQVVGANVDVVGRSRRLIGLLVDRGFGLAAWAPAYLAGPPALVWLGRRGGRGWQLVGALVVVGWCVATWVALTMHGWWWPGRQVVPVLPLVAVAVAAAVDRSRAKVAAIVSLHTIAAASWLWLVFEASTGRRALIVDFQETANPLYRAWRNLLPDHQRYRLDSVGLTIAWIVVVVGSAALVWHRTPGPPPPSAAQGGDADGSDGSAATFGDTEGTRAAVSASLGAIHEP